MTPEQKHKVLENELATNAKKFLQLRHRAETPGIPPATLAMASNTMLYLKKVIQNILFDMFLVDLDEKLNKLKAGKEEKPCLESTVNSQPQVVSDGGTAQDL